ALSARVECRRSAPPAGPASARSASLGESMPQLRIPGVAGPRVPRLRRAHPAAAILLAPLVLMFALVALVTLGLALALGRGRGRVLWFGGAHPTPPEREAG